MSSYVLRITGKRLDTFIMLLARLNISFKVLKRTREYLIIEVVEEDYANLLKINTTYDIEIVKRKGLLNIVHFLKARKLFVIVSLIGFAFFNLLTNLIFSIKVIDTDSELREIILNDLEEFGLKKYNFKISYEEKEKIESKILKKEKDIIEWIEIEEKGVSYEVKLIRRVKNDIEKVRDKVDVLLVSMHWGNEYQTEPTAEQKRQAEYLSSLGVDIIIGTHPHIIEPITYINDTLVIYSLGNFISAQSTNNDYNTMVELMTSVDIIKEEKDGFKVVPFSRMNETYNSDYQRLYDKYSAVVKMYDPNIKVNPLKA